MTHATKRPMPTPTPMTAALQRTVNYTELMLPMATAPGVLPHYATRLCEAMQRQGIAEATIITALLHLVVDVLAGRLQSMADKGEKHAGVPVMLSPGPGLPPGRYIATPAPSTGRPRILGGSGDAD